MNVAKNLDKAAILFPDRPAISENDSEITYLDFNRRANRVATGLINLGIQPGDMVGLCAPNSADWLAFYFGVLKSGAVAVTLSSALQRDELELLLTHAKPRLILMADDKLQQIERYRQTAGIEKIISPNGDLPLLKLLELGCENFRSIERDRNDTAAVLYTGGTTGTPKGVMLTHENINVSSHNVAYSEHSSETDRVLCCLPLNHVFGQIHIMNATIFSCGCIELLPSYDMELVIHQMDSGKVTKFYAVPTIYSRLLSSPDLKQKLGAVRYCFSAAASMA
ncbi:MAG: long-chain acyl-CoA synthetase, partial [Thermodesulfobacteriota bacterium]|nr:long-chain acyl-CoA synthetase [Thermodesulfobacteriota bacterium]